MITKPKPPPSPLLINHPHSPSCGKEGVRGWLSNYSAFAITEYFDVMIYRDLIERYQERNVHALKFFLRRCIESVTSLLSVNKIHNTLKSAGFRISKNTVYDYLEQVQAIYFLQLAQKYDPLLVRRELGDKKAYIIDNALLEAMNWQIGQDKGKLLENLVAMELRKQGLSLNFIRSKLECDFVLQSTEDQTWLPMQVCYDLSEPSTHQREVAGLIAACQFCKTSKGIILTMDQEAQLQENGIHIQIIPVWKYLLL